MTVTFEEVHANKIPPARAPNCDASRAPRTASVRTGLFAVLAKKLRSHTDSVGNMNTRSFDGLL
jgi:hypothetical protein